MRGITARQRNEDTAKRVGLTIPAYQTEGEDMVKYAEKIGLGESDDTQSCAFCVQVHLCVAHAGFGCSSQRT